MKTENAASAAAGRSSGNGSLMKFLTIVAWTLVVVGLLAIIPGVWRMFSEANDWKTATTLSNLSALGGYLQGAVQSLWSLAAFLFIYVAFLGQMEQMKQQAKQFELEQKQDSEQILQQQIELADQRQQLRIQNESIKLQSFENSFFQLLNLHNQNASEMRHVDPVNKQEFFGRACFEKWYKDAPVFRMVEDEPIMLSSLERYQSVVDQHANELGQYFRNLYHVIKYVNESDALNNDDPAIDYKNRRRYTTLARATLSQFELALLFYNGLTEQAEKFKPFIEKFGLLENFDRDDLYNREADEKLYEPKAFA